MNMNGTRPILELYWWVGESVRVFALVNSLSWRVHCLRCKRQCVCAESWREIGVIVYRCAPQFHPLLDTPLCRFEVC